MVLISALAISLGASFLVYRITAAQQPAPVRPLAHLVVAARDLGIGTIVRESDLKMSDWVGTMPKGSSVKSVVLLNRGVVSTIYENEPVTESRLAVAGSGGGLAATFCTGTRACAVKVNEVVGVAGLYPRNACGRPDYGHPPGRDCRDWPSRADAAAKYSGLSAGANIDKDREGKPQPAQVVNLLVTPDQAEILKSGRQ